jgi:hypothetical protein
MQTGFAKEAPDQSPKRRICGPVHAAYRAADEVTIVVRLASEGGRGSPDTYRSVSVSMAAAITGGQTPLPIILILSRRLPCSNR